jgi:hypothetical protein
VFVDYTLQLSAAVELAALWLLTIVLAIECSSDLDGTINTLVIRYFDYAVNKCCCDHYGTTTTVAAVAATQAWALQ